MHVFEEKKRHKEPEIIGKECASCGHKRKETDHAPAWQCPCCKVAYHKVTDEYIKSQNQKVKQEIAEKYGQKKEKDKKIQLGEIGMFAGLLSYIKGAGGACMGILATPILKPIGIIIGVVSAAYILFNTFFK